MGHDKERQVGRLLLLHREYPLLRLRSAEPNSQKLQHLEIVWGETIHDAHVFRDGGCTQDRVGTREQLTGGTRLFLERDLDLTAAYFHISSRSLVGHLPPENRYLGWSLIVDHEIGRTDADLLGIPEDFLLTNPFRTLTQRRPDPRFRGSVEISDPGYLKDLRHSLQKGLFAQV